jgi:hypothetical protein
MDSLPEYWRWIVPSRWQGARRGREKVDRDFLGPESRSGEKCPAL